jgi:translation initiation factor 4G
MFPQQGRGGNGGYSGFNRRGPVKQLVVSEDSWVSRRKNVGDDEKLVQSIRGTLNKLSDKTFRKLGKEIQDIVKPRLEDEDFLNSVIVEFFDKAWRGESFAGLFARLCATLSEEFGEWKSSDGKTTTLKRHIANQCEKVFTSGHQTIDTAGKTAAEAKELRLIQKHKMLGNIRFIGELYKEELLSRKIMTICVDDLLNGGLSKEDDRDEGRKDLPTDDELESLWKLLNTIGPVLYANCQKAPPGRKKKTLAAIEAWFNRLVSLGKDERLPNRIRFKIQDIIELKENGWRVPGSVDPNSTRSRLRTRFSQRGRSSRGNASRNMALQRRPQDRYASATGVVDSRAGDVRRTPQIQSSTRNPPLDRDPRAPVRNQRFNRGTSGGQQRASMGSTSNPQRQSPSPAPPLLTPTPSKPKGLTEEQQRRKMKSFILEYVESQEMDEAVECLKEIGNPKLHPAVIVEAFSAALDAKAGKIIHFRNLICGLHKSNVLRSEAILEGLDETWDLLADLMIDAPQAPQLLGKYCVQLVEDDILTLAQICRGRAKLQNAVQMDIISRDEAINAGLNFLETVLQELNEKGMDVQELWQQSGLNLEAEFGKTRQSIKELVSI